MYMYIITVYVKGNNTDNCGWPDKGVIIVYYNMHTQWHIQHVLTFLFDE